MPVPEVQILLARRVIKATAVVMKWGQLRWGRMIWDEMNNMNTAFICWLAVWYVDDWQLAGLLLFVQYRLKTRTVK